MLTQLEEKPTPPDYNAGHYIECHTPAFTACFRGPSPSEKHVCKMEDPAGHFQVYERERRERNQALKASASQIVYLG